MKNDDNKIKKNWKIILLLSSFSTLILAFIISVVWFFGYRTVDHTSSLDYKGNHYYSTAYIQPNLSDEGKETSIFGGATYIGLYKNKEMNLYTESKLWKIKDIPQNKLIVEMTPNGHSTTFMVWGNKKLRNIKEAFDFLKPNYLSYLTYDNKQSMVHQVEVSKQHEITHEVRKIIQRKPNFSKLSTVEGKSINEIYFNESPKQSLVLQASLLEIKNKGTYMHFSGEKGRIGYWKVNDKLVNLLK